MHDPKDDAINLEIRRFLKAFGIAAQRDLDRAAQAGTGTRTLRVRAALEINGEPAHVETAEIRLG